MGSLLHSNSVVSIIPESDYNYQFLMILVTQMESPELYYPYALPLSQTELFLKLSLHREETIQVRLYKSFMFYVCSFLSETTKFNWPQLQLSKHIYIFRGDFLQSSYYFDVWRFGSIRWWCSRCLALLLCWCCLRRMQLWRLPRTPLKSSHPRRTKIMALRKEHANEVVTIFQVRPSLRNIHS